MDINKRDMAVWNAGRVDLACEIVMRRTVLCIPLVLPDVAAVSTIGRIQENRLLFKTVPSLPGYQTVYIYQDTVVGELLEKVFAEPDDSAWRVWTLEQLLGYTGPSNSSRHGDYAEKPPSDTHTN